jgi:arginase
MTTFIGLASGLGGRSNTASEGPLLIKKHLPFDALWKEMILPEEAPLSKWDHIPLLNNKLAEATYASASVDPFTVVIGGDHSCAVGTWSGIAEAKRLQGQDIALLWLDAHMDCHTDESSETGNIHGMPLAALLGHGSPRLTEILSQNPKVKPENVFLIGVRSYEAPERVLVERLNIRVYYMEEVAQRGLKAIFSEILARLSAQKIPYGISVDIDFFDPGIMSATGSPEEKGADLEEFLESYTLTEAYPPIAFEFVEYNPFYDNEGRSLQAVYRILDHVLQRTYTP